MEAIQWLISHISIILDLIAGVLISWDLIMTDQRARNINRTWHNRLKLPPAQRILSNAFGWGVPWAFALAGGLVTYSVLKESQTTSSTNIVWVPVFFAGFIVGINVQWFVTRYLDILFRRLRWNNNPYSPFLASTLILFVLALFSFTQTAGSVYLMPLTLGLLYGVTTLEISILSITALRRFLTTDPNSERNPRVLARGGLLLFVISRIIELFH